MATISIRFVPSNVRPFSFQAALTDTSGNTGTYQITLTWNIFRRGYYVRCTDQNGQHVFTLPLIGSPDSADINIAAGYLSSLIVYRPRTRTFEIT